MYLSPALVDGPSFAPADLGRGLSILTQSLHPLALHNNINGDVIDQGIAWNTFDYQLVHHGQFPLWNALSGNGLPGFLNFESAVLALPSLIGYLVPLSVSFLVTVAAKLLIAGFGTYWCCRLLGARPLAASLGGTTFMLSGAFSGWLGWPISGVYCFSGLALAALLLCYRRSGVAPVALLALVVAFSVYAGFPEADVLLAAGLAVVALGVGLSFWRSKTPIKAPGLVRIGVASAAGLALSSPLWLPGVAVIRQSARAGKDVATGLSLHSILLVFAQGYEGLPIRGSTFFGSGNYFETSAYVGVIALVLAVVALVACWRRPIVVGLGLAGLGCLAVIFRLGAHDPIQALVRSLGLGSIAVQRALSLLGFVLAVLAGLGAELVLARLVERRVRRSLLAAVALVALVILAMWSRVGQAGASSTCLGQLSAASCRSLRRSSLYWPSATLIGLALLLGMYSAWPALRRIAPGLFGAAFLLGQSLFLLFAGVGINSYAGTDYPLTPAVSQLQSLLGGSLVALDGGNGACGPSSSAACGLRDWIGVGLYPAMNLGYGIAELALHDPTAPQAYFSGWPVPNSGQISAGNLNLFAPDVNSVALARRYGASYVLVKPNLVAPSGMHKVAELATAAGAEGLYTVPGAARFSFLSSRRVEQVRSGNGSYRLKVATGTRAVLIARITDSPGWHASSDGRALVIKRAPGDLISVVVPAGASNVSFSYGPRDFYLGLLLATLTALGFFLAGLFGYRKRRRKA